jgi:surfeit locus 1 family protein
VGRREGRGRALERIADPVAPGGPAARSGGGRRPKWWTLRGVLAAVLVVAAASVCMSFGFWQLDRHEQRKQRNETVRAARDLPAAALDAALIAAISADPGAYAYRRIRVAGTVPTASEFLLRGRSHMGQPGVNVLAPLHLSGSDAVVLVNRGWLGAADAATVDPRPYAEPEAREVEGIVLPYPDAAGEGRPLHVDLGDFRVFSVGRIDRPAVESHLAVNTLPFYIQQLPEAAPNGPPVRLGFPELDGGPHLMYAVQWFGFAAVFLIGLMVVALRRSP